MKLAAAKKHWQRIGRGLSLGYRRTNSAASWYIRYFDNDEKERQKALAIADDFQEADSKTILTYRQAVRMAEDFIASLDGHVGSEYTVADTVADYLVWYKSHRKAYQDAKRVCDAHILPHLGRKKTVELTTKEMRHWHRSIAEAPARLRSGIAGPRVRDVNDPRARKATANRILTVLKAALNHAWREGDIPTDAAWRPVKPFPNVDQAKVHYISRDEAQRLVNACEPDFRHLVQASLLTGCRYGELTSMEVVDYNPDAKAVHVKVSKSGKPRHVPLSDDGAAFFDRLTAGRTGSERMFLRADGKPWGKSHQTRPLIHACKHAKIDPPASFHILRHTYASHLVMNGAPLEVVAHCLGHSDTRMTIRHYAHLAPSFVADIIRNHLPTLGNVESDNVIPMSKGA